MTDKPESPPRVDRRSFLRGAGVAAVAAPLAASAEQLAQPTDNQVPARYRETEHVTRFYELNRR